MKLTIKLPGDFTTKKNSPVLIGGTRPRMLPSKAFRDWLAVQLLQKSILKRKLGDAIPVKQPCSITALFYRSRDVGDWTGYLDALADLIQSDAWRCERPDVVVKMKRDGKRVSSPVCRRKTVTDVAPDRCPFCQYPMPKRVRQGLGIIQDDRQIQHWDGTRLLLDPDRPRIEMKIITIEPPQLSLLGGLP